MQLENGIIVTLGLVGWNKGILDLEQQLWVGGEGSHAVGDRCGFTGRELRKKTGILEGQRGGLTAR